MPSSRSGDSGSGTARSPNTQHFYKLTQKVSPILHKPNLAKVKLEFFHFSLQYYIVEIKSKMHNGQKYKALVLSLFYYPFLVKTTWPLNNELTLAIFDKPGSIFTLANVKWGHNFPKWWWNWLEVDPNSRKYWKLKMWLSEQNIDHPRSCLLGSIELERLDQEKRFSGFLICFFKDQSERSLKTFLIVMNDVLNAANSSGFVPILELYNQSHDRYLISL